MMAIRASFVLSLASVMGAASAQTVTLRYQPPVGKSFSYAMSMDMRQSVPGMPTPISMHEEVPMTMRIVSRSGPSTVVDVRLGQAHVTLPKGSPMAASKAQIEQSTSNVSSRSTVDVYGKFSSVKSSNPMAAQMGGGMSSGLQGVAFPSRPVRVGESWTQSMDMGKIPGVASSGARTSGTIPIRYTLVNLRRVGGTTLATIRTEMNGHTKISGQGQTMNMTMRSGGNAVIDVATGLARTTSMSTDVTMLIGGKSMTMHMSMAINLR